VPTIHLPQRDKVILEGSRVGRARGDRRTHFYYMQVLTSRGISCRYPIRYCDWVRVDLWELDIATDNYPTCKKCQKLVNRVLENALKGGEKDDNPKR